MSMFKTLAGLMRRRTQVDDVRSATADVDADSRHFLIFRYDVFDPQSALGRPVILQGPFPKLWAVMCKASRDLRIYTNRSRSVPRVHYLGWNDELADECCLQEPEAETELLAGNSIQVFIYHHSDDCIRHYLILLVDAPTHWLRT